MLLSRDAVLQPACDRRRMSSMQRATRQVEATARFWTDSVPGRPQTIDVASRRLPPAAPELRPRYPLIEFCAAVGSSREAAAGSSVSVAAESAGRPIGVWPRQCGTFSPQLAVRDESTGFSCTRPRITGL